MNWKSALFASVLVSSLALPSHASDWPQFRGPGGAGVSALTNMPLKWSGDADIAWKTALPGPGSSCPAVFGERIYLTCFTGYGMSKETPGEMTNLTYHLLCIDARDGKIIWDRAVKAVTPVVEYKSQVTLHGYTSSTPAVDDKGVVVFFANTGVCAWRHDGTQVWATSVGAKTHNWHSGTSPVLYRDTVIVNACIESGSLIGLHRETGARAWSVGDIVMSWSTPLIVDIAGRAEAVVMSKGMIRACDPLTGTLRWTCTGIDDYICPSPVAANGVVYGIGARRNEAMAVRAGGSGDVTASNVLWRVRKGSNVSSPVWYEGNLYFANEKEATVHCIDASSGEVKYEEKLAPSTGLIYASPLVADGKLYYVSRENGTFVLPASPVFKVLAQNRIAGDGSVFNASPVPLAHGRLLLRSDKALYCIKAGK